MPIYEYSCGKCGEVIERIQKFSDPPVRRHPGCGGALTKLISRSAFQLKGSGWYVTDYARPKAGETSGSETGTEGANGSGTADKTEKQEKNQGKKQEKKKDDKKAPSGGSDASA